METVKQLMKSGDVRGAAEKLKAILAAQPGDAEAMMLYGTCCHLLGDEATFRRIHDELAPKMATVTNSETQSLWRKYHTLWIGLIATGLALAGGVVAIAYLGRTVTTGRNVTCTALAAYRGPGYQKLQKSDSPQDVVSKWELEQGGATNATSLRKNQICPACNGTGFEKGAVR